MNLETLEYSNYPGLRRITPNYRGLQRITRITPIYLDYSELVRNLICITPSYFELRGLPVRITKWSNRLSELFPHRDYCRLHRITPDYYDLPGLLQITPIYFRLFRIQLK